MIFRNITYVALTNKMADTCVRLRQTRVQARPVSGLGKMIAQCTRIAYAVWRGLRLLTKWRKLASAMRQLAYASRADFHFFHRRGGIIVGGVQVICNMPFLMLRERHEMTN